MKVFFSDAQLGHDPQQFMVAGRVVTPFEVPERARRLSERLRRDGLGVEAPPDSGLAAINAVHTKAYTDFLSTAYERFQALPGAGPEAFPNVHPHVSAPHDGRARDPIRPTGIIGQMGWYVGDMACAIGPRTWDAAYASAQAAIAAAAVVMTGEETAIALCRPPGHHAYADRASGFCFLNNAAIAAEQLRQMYSRVAILDFDTHHGDGTQSIFYARPNVFVGSTHTDPDAYYPYFVGYADERGVGAGIGSNLNIPLAPGSGDDAFLAANDRLIEAARAFGAEAIVISAGWDAHRDDPLSKLDVSDAAYAALGERYARLQVPIVIVTEGGYSLSAIERVAPLFLSQYAKARADVL